MPALLLISVLKIKVCVAPECQETIIGGGRQMPGCVADNEGRVDKAGETYRW